MEEDFSPHEWALETEDESYYSDIHHVYLVTSLANLRRRELIKLGPIKTLEKTKNLIEKELEVDE